MLLGTVNHKLKKIINLHNKKHIPTDYNLSPTTVFMSTSWSN